MQSFIPRHKFILIAALISFVFVFIFIPTMEAIPYLTTYHCFAAKLVPLQEFCNTDALTSIVTYILTHDRVNEANRNEFFITFISMFFLYYFALRFNWPFLTSKNIGVKLCVIAVLVFFPMLIYYIVYTCVTAVIAYCD